jgi:hypothetical protein
MVSDPLMVMGLSSSVALPPPQADATSAIAAVTIHIPFRFRILPPSGNRVFSPEKVII